MGLDDFLKDFVLKVSVFGKGGRGSCRAEHIGKS